MLNLNINVTDKDSGWDVFAQKLSGLSGKAVKVGIQSDEGTDLLEYAGANEFGATIQHPGGTSYGYKNKKDIESGKVSFLKKGQGYIELGVTGPHTIEIPARPFIRQTFAKKMDELSNVGFDLAKLVLSDKLTLDQALQNWGDQFVSDIRKEVAEGNNFIPNAPATIKLKGAGLHPLQDSGRLMQALKSVIVEV